MSSISSWTGVGRLSRDAELKYTPAGKPVVRLTVVTNHRTNAGGQWVDEPDFWDCDLWGERGEKLVQYLEKGTLVAVTGEMRQERWEDQSGKKMSKAKVVIQQIQLLGSSSRPGESKAPAQAQHGQSKAAAPADDYPDDIPF
jgi:single-strand DNA-binding protein